jgi:hypothetical protein
MDTEEPQRGSKIIAPGNPGLSGSRPGLAACQCRALEGRQNILVPFCRPIRGSLVSHPHRGQLPAIPGSPPAIGWRPSRARCPQFLISMNDALVAGTLREIPLTACAFLMS